MKRHGVVAPVPVRHLGACSYDVVVVVPVLLTCGTSEGFPLFEWFPTSLGAFQRKVTLLERCASRSLDVLERKETGLIRVHSLDDKCTGFLLNSGVILKWKVPKIAPAVDVQLEGRSRCFRPAGATGVNQVCHHNTHTHSHSSQSGSRSVNPVKSQTAAELGLQAKNQWEPQ